MSKKIKFAIFIFKIIPKSLISRISGYFTRIPLPLILLNSIIKWYCKRYGVKNEYIIPEKGFKNFNEFFIRRLKNGIHNIDNSAKAVVSPVDASIDRYGEIKKSTLIQAKGLDYSLNDLIPSETAKEFVNGNFFTLYLSPADYHRIHSPVSGIITGYFNIPGKLFTVQEYMARGLEGLYVKNERIISYINTDAGLVGVCKIGAFNVGRISLSYNDIISNKAFRHRKEYFHNKEDQISINRGDELGIFHLGSTVILLFQKGAVKFNKFEFGEHIRVGEKIGALS